jgi:hypothetical protein
MTKSNNQPAALDEYGKRDRIASWESVWYAREGNTPGKWGVAQDYRTEDMMPDTYARTWIIQPQFSKARAELLAFAPRMMQVFASMAPRLVAMYQNQIDKLWYCSECGTDGQEKPVDFPHQEHCPVGQMQRLTDEMKKHRAEILVAGPPLDYFDEEERFFKKVDKGNL